MPPSFDVDVALYLLHLLFIGLWHGHCKHAVVHLGGDVVLYDVIGQHVGLLIVGVAELTAQEMLLFVLFLVLQLVFDGDVEVSVGVDAYPAKFLFDAWHSQLHGVALRILLYVDSRCSGFHLRHPVAVEEIVKYCGKPTVCVHYW